MQPWNLSRDSNDLLCFLFSFYRKKRAQMTTAVPLVATMSMELLSPMVS